MRSCCRWHLPVVGLVALSVTFGLSSCKEKSDTPTAGGPGAITAPEGVSGTKAADAGAIGAAFEKPRKAEGDISVQIITNNSSDFWQTMGKGMDDGKAEVKCQAKWVAPSGAKPTHIDQKAVFEQILANNPDGIAVSPIQSNDFGPVIDAAIEKGIPVLTFDSDTVKSKRLAYVGTNNYEAGKKAGEEAIRLLGPTGGKVVAFVGNLTAQSGLDRYKGFKDAVAGKNIEMLQEPFQDNADQTGAAYRNVQDAITKYGDKINLFLGIWAYNGPAIVDEVGKAGIRSKVKIVVFDGAPKTLEALKNGTIDAAIVQKPYEFGRVCTKLLYFINRKGYSAAIKEMTPELEKAGMKVNGSIIDTGVEIVTPANAKPFLEKLEKMGLKST